MRTFLCSLIVDDGHDHYYTYHRVIWIVLNKIFKFVFLSYWLQRDRDRTGSGRYRTGAGPGVEATGAGRDRDWPLRDQDGNGNDSSGNGTGSGTTYQSRAKL